MKNTYSFTTRNNNNYCYSRPKRQLLLIHPILKYLIELLDQKINLPVWFKTLPDQTNIPTFGQTSKKAIAYYLDYLALLAQNGYFDRESNSYKQCNARLTGRSIQCAIANTPMLVFEVTEACNLNCAYCAYGDLYCTSAARKSRHLTFAKAKTLLDYLAKLWNSSLNQTKNTTIHISFYGGEPLLNFNLIEKIVAYTKQIKLKRNFFVYGMTTNGVLLDKHMDFLVRNKFDLSISLDGNKQHNEYRALKNGGNSYDIVISNARMLKRKHPQYFKRHVSFNSVLHNKNDVHEMADFFRQNFDQIPNISEINHIGINPAKRAEFNQKFRNLRASIGNQTNCQEIKKKLFLELPQVADIVEFYHFKSGFSFSRYRDILASPPAQRLPTGTCIPFMTKIFLTANGKLLPCERIPPDIPLGQVSETKIKLDFDTIAAKLNKMFDAIGQCCKACAVRSECSECIFNIMLDTRRNSKNPCLARTNNKQHAALLAGMMSFFEENTDIYRRIFREVIVG